MCSQQVVSSDGESVDCTEETQAGIETRKREKRKPTFHQQTQKNGAWRREYLKSFIIFYFKLSVHIKERYMYPYKLFDSLDD